MKLDELVAALAAGNKGAFAELYEQTKKTVYYVALSVVRDRALAEDVMQTAYSTSYGMRGVSARERMPPPGSRGSPATRR